MHLLAHINLSKICTQKECMVKNGLIIERNYVCLFSIYICLYSRYIYVGETSQPLRDRIRAHLSSIRNNYNLPVAHHFNSKDHSLNNFYFTGINTHNNTSSRKHLENKYIRSLLCNNLINIKSDTNHIFNVTPFSYEYAFINCKLKSSLSNFDVGCLNAYTRSKNLGAIFKIK